MWSINAGTSGRSSSWQALSRAAEHLRGQPIPNIPHSNAVSWRESRLLVALEFAIVAGLFVADVYHHIFFSKTPYLFVLGWVSLRLRRMRWKDVGFSRPRRWGTAFLVGIAAGLCMEALELFVTQPLLARWLGKMPNLSDFADL